jgi:N-acetylglucosaminyl-diphospho-decaprenol L-rhamnosyltransferase
MTDDSDILISIVNYRTPQHCISCLESLEPEREFLPRLRVLVVDGASGDGSANAIQSWVEKMRHEEWIAILPLPINGGFGWAHNQAMMRALHDPSPPAYIYLLNPDTVVELGAVAALRRAFDLDPKIACVGSQLVNLDGSLGGSAFRFPSIRREFATGIGISKVEKLLGIGSGVIFSRSARQVDWVTGASVMIRSEALKQAGLFDDGFFLYREEIELMHRMTKNGWKVWHEPASMVVHEGGASTGVETGNLRPLKRLPPYCYISRRRYFALTSGRLGAFFAGLSWLVGRFARIGLSPFLSKLRKHMVPHELEDFLSTGFMATSSDLTRTSVSWQDDAGSQPAWIELYGTDLPKGAVKKRA